MTKMKKKVAIVCELYVHLQWENNYLSPADFVRLSTDKVIISL